MPVQTIPTSDRALDGDHMTTTHESPDDRSAAIATTTVKKTDLSDFVAVLDPVPFRRARTRRLLAGLGFATLGFDRSAELGAKLVSGYRFTMLVLAFKGSVASARFELEYLIECVGPEVPIMLLVDPAQVELAPDVMGSDYYDVLTGPCSEEELLARLGLMYLNWSRQIHVDLARRMQGSIDGRRGGESRPLPL